MVHTNCERNNALVVRDMVAARREACNRERNNAPTLKMEKWNGYSTVLWVVGMKLAQFTTTGRPNSRVGPVAKMSIQLARLFM